MESEAFGMVSRQTELYRGVNTEQRLRDRGRVLPKRSGPFAHAFKLDGILRHDGSATFGPTSDNAVLGHQLAEESIRTSGVSTTHVVERARYYATCAGKVDGVLYVLDRARAAQLGVVEFVVADHVAMPHVPEDMEVILVAPGDGEVPAELVLEMIEVTRDTR